MNVLLPTEKIYLRRGEDCSEVFEYLQENLQPVDLSGKTVEFRLLFDEVETVLNADSSSGTAIISAPLAGQITVTLPKTLINGLPNARGKYVLSVVGADGDKARLLHGELLIRNFYEF